jgi:hypothetical protein
MVDIAQPTSHFNHNRRIRRLFSYKVLLLLIFNQSRLLGEETVKVEDFRNPSLAAVGQNDRMKARIKQESLAREPEGDLSTLLPCEVWLECGHNLSAVYYFSHTIIDVCAFNAIYTAYSSVFYI